MIGAIIGDIVGSRFEFNNYRRKDFDLFTKDCKVTDDSIMTLAVAKSIMETEKILKPSFHSTHPIYYAQVEKMSVKYMQEIGRKYPNCGYGGRFKEWVHSDTPRPYNSFGNGAAMRVSPVGFAAKTEREVSLLSKAVTRVTHNHQEGIKGAEAVAVAIYMAQRGWSKDEIQKKSKDNIIHWILQLMKSGIPTKRIYPAKEPFRKPSKPFLNPLPLKTRYGMPSPSGETATRSLPSQGLLQKAIMVYQPI